MRIEDIAVSDHDCPGVHLPPPPRISYIISTHNRTEFIPRLLACLKVQTDKDFEVIVTDNTVDERARQAISEIVHREFPNCVYISTRLPTCFHSAEVGVERAKGEFVCFPSDDSVYAKTFGETMYHTAVTHPADLVMCSMVYDPRCGHQRYTACPQKPERFWFDKTGFILRRTKFQDFPGKVLGYEPRTTPTVCSDALLAELLVRQGVSWLSIPDVLALNE